MAASRSERVGEVTLSETRTVILDVSVHVDSFPVDYTDETEFLLRVNGRAVKRMNYFTAQRMGIV